jgi:hypothetical protein
MAAGSTYTPIATTTLGSNTASYTFSSISGSYTDLVLVCQVQQVTDGEDFAVQVNGDTAANYSRTYLCGDGSTAHSGRSSSASNIILDHHATPPTASSFTVNILNFENYSNATTYKTVLARSNSLSTYGGAVAVVGLWRNTAAITSITVFCTNSSNMKTGSTFTLYGIASA